MARYYSPHSILYEHNQPPCKSLSLVKRSLNFGRFPPIARPSMSDFRSFTTVSVAFRVPLTHPAAVAPFLLTRRESGTPGALTAG